MTHKPVLDMVTFFILSSYEDGVPFGLSMGKLVVLLPGPPRHTLKAIPFDYLV